MNRRAFLSGLLGTAAAMTLDPERLLWRPGAKLISIPKASPLELISSYFTTHIDFRLVERCYGSGKTWDARAILMSFDDADCQERYRPRVLSETYDYLTDALKRRCMSDEQKGSGDARTKTRF